ncbi:MAG: hypothetical protein H0T13_01750 [Actinobacteria bacterium]|nr:hypothetical protein [Actinomycetota bacterium]
MGALIVYVAPTASSIVSAPVPPATHSGAWALLFVFAETIASPSEQPPDPSCAVVVTVMVLAALAAVTDTVNDSTPISASSPALQALARLPGAWELRSFCLRSNMLVSSAF